MKGHVCLQNGVRADHQVGLTARQPCFDGALFGRRGGTGQKLGVYAGFAEHGPHRGVVLCGQNLGRSHQGALVAVSHGGVDHGFGHSGLAAAHVALDQAVHTKAALHVLYTVLNGRRLRIRQLKRQKLQKIAGIISLDLYRRF